MAVTRQDLELVLVVLGVGRLARGHVLEGQEAEAAVVALVQGVLGRLEVNHAVHLEELLQHRLLKQQKQKGGIRPTSSSGVCQDIDLCRPRAAFFFRRFR